MLDELTQYAIAETAEPATVATRLRGTHAYPSTAPGEDDADDEEQTPHSPLGAASPGPG